MILNATFRKRKVRKNNDATRVTYYIIKYTRFLHHVPNTKANEPATKTAMPVFYIADTKWKNSKK